MGNTNAVWRPAWLLVVWLLTVAESRAQWQTQEIELHPGWNAVYLHVDPGHVSLDELVNVTGNPIAEIWRWQPNLSTAQYVTTPAEPTTGLSQWVQWTRTAEEDSLRHLIGNAAYLVHNTNSSTFTWQVPGRPVAPRYDWTTSGLNFVGFPTVPGAEPHWSDFLDPAPTLKTDLTLYEYAGGEAIDAAPVVSEIFNYFTGGPSRGRAFWLNNIPDGETSGDYNRYFGPFQVEVDGDGLDYGDNLSLQSVRLRNVTAETISVQAALHGSEQAPAGQQTVLGQPTLLVRGALDPTDLSHDYTELDDSVSWTLAPAGEDGSEVEVVIGLDRAAMHGGTAGTAMVAVSEDELEAESNTAYQLLSGTAVAVTLPEEAQAGDVVSFTRAGNTAGWSVAPAESWTDQTLNPARTLVALSSDGVNILSAMAGGKLDMFDGTSWSTTEISAAGDEPDWSAITRSDNTLVAALNGGGLYVATGSGWVAQDVDGDGDSSNDTNEWSAVAADDDGGLLAATADGGLWAYADPSWSEVTGPGATNYWSAVALNAGGGSVQLAAASGYALWDGTNFVRDVTGGGLWLSTDSGTNWANQSAELSVKWTDVAISEDGSRLVAVGSDSAIYLGTNSSGTVTWSEVAESEGDWQSVAMSPDGQFIVAAAPEETLYHSADFGASWESLSESGQRFWSSVAVGQTTAGTYALAAAALGGGVYHSSDNGVTWTVHGRPEQQIAASADGQGLLLAEHDGPLHTSSDGGVTWTERSALGEQDWSAVALSTNGQVALAAVAGGAVHYSEDGGANWAEQDITGGGTNWVAVAVSADGVTLLAAVDGGLAYLSTNAGGVWTAQDVDGDGDSSNDTHEWSSLSLSANGVTLLATVAGGAVWLSENAGVDWATNSPASAASWVASAMSDTGGTMLVAADEGAVYLTTDGGASWAAQDLNADGDSSNDTTEWSAVAVAGDGSRVFALAADGALYRSEVGFEDSDDDGTLETVVAWVEVDDAGTREWTSLAVTSEGDRSFLTAAEGPVVSGASSAGHTGQAGETVYYRHSANGVWEQVSEEELAGAAMAPGELQAGILRFTDAGGRLQVDVGVSATVAAPEGLWIGAATVTHVGHYLTDFAGAVGEVLTDEATGSYIARDVDTSLGTVSRPFPLRLIVHQDTNGTARLLQRVFVGVDAGTNAVVASAQSVLHPGFYGLARRLSAGHLPWSEDNVFWQQSAGSLALGSTLEFEVPLDYNDHASNPFLHTFHPDHDNLRTDFSTVAIQGAESYTVRRRIRLTCQRPGADFTARTAAGTGLSGLYTETVSVEGAAGQSRDFTLSGSFSLNRVSPIGRLSTPE